MLHRYFNPRSPRGGATTQSILYANLTAISIHAPHEGERRDCRKPPPSQRGISIHAPHEGERQSSALKPSCKNYFNPRSPRGGATNFHSAHSFFVTFQSTLPTRGSDKFRTVAAVRNEGFQSTLPTRGSDRAGKPLSASPANFNPRSPRGGATCAVCR